jgi:cell division protein FtsL
MKEKHLLKCMVQDGLRHWAISVLGLIILLLSLSTVYLSFLNRQLTGHWDLLLKQQDELNIEWHHLILEEQSQTEHHKIREFSKQKFNMKQPQPNDEKVLMIHEKAS